MPTQNKLTKSDPEKSLDPNEHQQESQINGSCQLGKINNTREHSPIPCVLHVELEKRKCKQIGT